MIVNLSVQALLQALGDLVISCDADDVLVVHRISSLQQAQAADLAVVLDRGDASVFDAVSVEAIKQSAAGVVMLGKATETNKKQIVVSDVLAAFTRVVALIEQEKIVTPAQIASSARVDASAVVSAGAVIGENTRIGALAFIGKHCVIGRNVLVHPGVKILDGCTVGDHTIIHAGAVIGSDGFGYQVTKTGLRKIPHIGIVSVGAGVEIGANCCIDRAAFDATVIGDGCKLDNAVHIAHNVKIGPSTAILAQTGIAGSVEIGMGCQIGGQVAIKDHVKIGNFVKIVSKSGVMSDLKDNEIVAGIPAIPFGQWKRTMVVFNKLPDYVQSVKKQSTFAGATKSWWRQLFE